jgi:hypothetical protein
MWERPSRSSRLYTQMSIAENDISDQLTPDNETLEADETYEDLTRLHEPEE